MSARESMCAAALAAEGLSASPVALYGFVPREAYKAFLAPGETAFRAEEMADNSGCALTVRRLWSEIGIVHPRLDAPYHDGHAVEDVCTIAREAHAVIEVEDAKPGDVVHVGYPEHVYTIMTIDACNGDWFVTSIDGGQKGDDGYQLIERRERAISDGHDTTQVSRPGQAMTTRQVLTVINTDKVFEAFGVVR